MAPETWSLGFADYLKSLSPSKSGSVECPFCDHPFGSELELLAITSHFRWCLLAQRLFGSCKDQLASVWTKDYNFKPYTIINNLRERCFEKREQLKIAAQAQLPSVTVFLTQLRAFCDGRLTCIGPKCQGAQCFDASWVGLESHFEQYHAYHLLQDEDFIGLVDVHVHLVCHKKDIERLFAKAQVHREEWAFMDTHSRVMEELRCNYYLKCECSTRGRLQTSPQFEVLKELSSVFRSRYGGFRRLAAESLSADLASFLREIREKCPTSKELRQLGTRIFKQVVQGTPPSTLLETFAFISLSQAMTTVMRNRDVQIDLDPGTIDYLAWRTCIDDEASRRLYDKIINIWFHFPGREELQCMSLNRSQQTTCIS